MNSEDVVDLYKRKVEHMSDSMLISECMIMLKALELGVMDRDNIKRSITLFTAASERPSMASSKEDFLTALKVLQVL